MYPTIRISRFHSLMTITLTLLFGGIWLGVINSHTSQAQNATLTLLPEQVAAMAATLQAMTPTSTPTPTPVPPYDEFEGTVLDNTKWIDGGGFDCQVQPYDGALAITNLRSPHSMNCDLAVNSPLVRLHELRVMEAQLMIKNDHNHHELNQGIALSSTSLSEPMYLFCGINAGDSAVAVAAGDILINGSMKEFYTVSDAVAVDYDEFHTFRWEVDASNLTCLVDGEVIDEVPLDRIEGIESMEFLLSLSSYRAEGAVATTHIDNVRIVWA